MSEPLVVVGAGGFGRETVDIIAAVNAAAVEPKWVLRGVVDDAPSLANLERLRARNVPYLGRVAEFPIDAWAAIAIGSPQARSRVAGELSGSCAGYATLIHPSAILGSQHVMGEGNIICAHVSVGTNVVLGRHVHLNPHVVLGHDARLGDCVSVNPNATVSGECVLETEVLVGAGAVVLQGLRVAQGALVGAAACLTRDAAPGEIVAGVPARRLRPPGTNRNDDD